MSVKWSRSYSVYKICGGGGFIWPWDKKNQGQNLKNFTIVQFSVKNLEFFFRVSSPSVKAYSENDKDFCSNMT